MPSVLVGTEEGLGWREVKTGGCGHKPRDAGHWRLEEMGSTSIHLLRVEGVQSCTHLALDSGLRLQGKGLQAPAVVPRYSSPRKLGKQRRLSPARLGPPPAGASHPQGTSLEPLPALGPAPGRPRGQRKEAAPPRGLSTLSSPPSENLTSGDTSKPQAALAEADGHGRVCPTPWGILASRIAEALQNLDPVQLPGPSEGPERTSVLRVGPRQGGG